MTGEANRINRVTVGKPKGRNRVSGEVPRGLAYSQSWNTRSQPIYAWVGRSPEKSGWRPVAVMMCKSLA